MPTLTPMPCDIKIVIDKVNQKKQYFENIKCFLFIYEATEQLV